MDTGIVVYSNSVLSSNHTSQVHSILLHSTCTHRYRLFLKEELSVNFSVFSTNWYNIESTACWPSQTRQWRATPLKMEAPGDLSVEVDGFMEEVTAGGILPSLLMTSTEAGRTDRTMAGNWLKWTWLLWAWSWIQNRLSRHALQHPYSVQRQMNHS